MTLGFKVRKLWSRAPPFSFVCQSFDHLFVNILASIDIGRGPDDPRLQGKEAKVSGSAGDPTALGQSKPREPPHIYTQVTGNEKALGSYRCPRRCKGDCGVFFLGPGFLGEQRLFLRYLYVGLTPGQSTANGRLQEEEEEVDVMWMR